MTLLKNRAINPGFNVRIEHHEVGIEARAKGALLMLEPAEMRGALAHPARQIGEREAAARGLGPDRSERQLERGDPSPCGDEIPRVSLFHCRRRRRMIARDDGTDALFERAPEVVAVLGRTDRR